MTIKLPDVPPVTDGLHFDAGTNGYNYAKQLDVSIRNPIVTRRLYTALAYQQLIKECQEGILEVIGEARDYGATWKDIGDFFGITPRAALDRYNRSTVESRQRYEAKRAEKRRELKEKNQ